jgi:hypothetical protein
MYLKNKIKKRRVDAIDELYERLSVIGLFEKYPDLGNIEDSYENILKKELNTLDIKFKPLKEEPKSRPHHLWVGINPPPATYTMRQLHDLTHRIVKKYKWLENSAWTVEQNTEGGIRPHIHMMVAYSQNTAPIRVIKMLSNAFNIERHSIECKTHLNGYLFGEHLDYITNIKTDSKKILINRDISDRKENKIENYYLNGYYKDVFDGCKDDDQSQQAETSGI